MKILHFEHRFPTATHGRPAPSAAFASANSGARPATHYLDVHDSFSRKTDQARSHAQSRHGRGAGRLRPQPRRCSRPQAVCIDLKEAPRLDTPRLRTQKGRRTEARRPLLKLKPGQTLEGLREVHEGRPAEVVIARVKRSIADPTVHARRDRRRVLIQQVTNSGRNRPSLTRVLN